MPMDPYHEANSTCWGQGCAPGPLTPPALPFPHVYEPLLGG